MRWKFEELQASVTPCPTTHLRKLVVLHHERPLEPAHLLLGPVDQYDIPRVDVGYEVAILDEVHMGAETDVVHEAVERLPPTLHRDDLLRLAHDLLRQGVLDGVARD